MLIDTHAHVNFSAFKEDAEPTIKRALEQDVRMILVGTQIDTSKEAVAMAEKFLPAPFRKAKVELPVAKKNFVEGCRPLHTFGH